MPSLSDSSKGYQHEKSADEGEDFGLEDLFGALSLESSPSHNPEAQPGVSSPILPLNPISHSANPITKQMLYQIRDDLQVTRHPEANLPVNFGSPNHRKLKADQWRTALEFDFPVSLIHIKSMRKPSGNITDDERLQKLIDLTMDLTLAIAWGLSRRTSPHHAERYMFYMKRYLAGIKENFPDYNLKPNHHYALHIPDILLAFRPLHGTWVFCIERLIGLLQRINSNSKIGRYALLVPCFSC